MANSGFGPCGLPLLSIGKHSRRIEHGAVLLVEVGERHGMYFIGGAQAAMEISACEGEACILDQIGLESEIACP